MISEFAYRAALALPLSDDGRGLDPNIVRPGWTALAVVAVLAVATYFLARSFLKHVKRSHEPWPDDETDTK